jgi:hypothetical protein
LADFGRLPLSGTNYVHCVVQCDHVKTVVRTLTDLQPMGSPQAARRDWTLVSGRRNARARPHTRSSIDVIVRSR